MPSELVAKLILQASRIVAASKLDAYHPDNFGRLLLVGPNGTHEVSLEEIGSAPGEFNIALKVKESFIPSAPDILEQALVIDGPFGMLECTEVLFLDEQSGELCRRSDSFLVTSQHGETLIQVDLNAVGTFVVKAMRAEDRVAS